MEKIRLYFVEAYDELMHKVTWPSWAELQESSVVVLVSAVIMSLMVVFMDVAFKYGTIGIYKAIIGG
jgi:preprotein translocase subunit SecE